MSLVFYLGIDVSKRSLAVNLKDPSKGNALWTNKSLPNNEKGFALIAETAVRKIAAKGYAVPFTIVVGMESTGVYGERLAYYFYERRAEGFCVYVLNPAGVRSFAKSAMTKNKNDAVDAHIIASYLSAAVPQGVVYAWVPPTPEEARLRALSKRREELVNLRTQEKNRLEKLGGQFCPPATVVSSVESVIEHVETEIQQIEKEISNHIDRHPGLKTDVDLMRGIPGLRRVDWGKMRRDTLALLREQNLPYSPDTKLRDLSVSDIQMLEITKAVSRDADIIIMDEPTSAITSREVEGLIAKIFELREKGIAIIYISHKMEEIFRIADQITILRDGSVVDSQPAKNYDIDKVIALMVGRTITNVYPKEQVPVGDLVFEAKHLTRKGVFELI